MPGQGMALTRIPSAPSSIYYPYLLPSEIARQSENLSIFAYTPTITISDYNSLDKVKCQ